MPPKLVNNKALGVAIKKSAASVESKLEKKLNKSFGQIEKQLVQVENKVVSYQQKSEKLKKGQIDIEEKQKFDRLVFQNKSAAQVLKGEKLKKDQINIEEKQKFDRLVFRNQRAAQEALILKINNDLRAEKLRRFGVTPKNVTAGCAVVFTASVLTGSFAFGGRKSSLRTLVAQSRAEDLVWTPREESESKSFDQLE